MAGLIKNQILKHLSKFTKNLSPDKISLSAMKGEGDLSNLELDEMVLTDLLALPGWIRLKKATCNKVTIKIQWTKLNSQPICLYLDEVIVEMETCDVPRTPTSATPVSSYNKGGKYGFAEQIIDGICLSINSVIVNFRSNKFSASIQVSRIMVQSKTPKWQDGDLFMTRLKNDLVGEVMIFKEAEWQTLRIEANALDSSLATTPLRLIANQSKIRIIIKKKISDCSIVSSRLQVNLDDLLWVLTDSQLSAAMSFATALRETISRSSDAALRPRPDDIAKSQMQSSSSSSSSSATTTSSHQNATSPQHSVQNSARPTSMPTKTGSKSQQQKAKIFDMYNITETSYHLYTGRIDLHLCDDVSPEESNHQRKVEGGAIQLVLYHLEFDIYPYHRAGETRVRWPKYEDSMKLRDAWASDLLKVFKEDVRTIREAYKSNLSPTGDKSVPSDGVVLRPNTKSTVRTDQYTYLKDGKPAPKPQQSELLESCIAVRVEDFVLFRVSTALDSKRSTPKRFLSSDKKLLLLPPEMSSIHVVFTDYYFADGRDFPVPHSNLFIVVNPICLSVDYLTLLWMNTFSLNLAKKVAEIPTKPPSKVHTDIRIEALMPRVTLPPTDVIGTQGRPGDLDGLQVQMSKVIVTNCRLPDSRASRLDLMSALENFNSSPLFNGVEFPNEADDCVAVAKRFPNHIARIDDGYEDPFIEEILRKRDLDATGQLGQFVKPFTSVPNQGVLSSYYNMTMNSFRLNAEKDVWCVVIDQLWLEFNVVKNSFVRSTRTLPLVESFPLTVWLYQCLPASDKLSTDEKSTAENSSHVATSVPDKVAIERSKDEPSGSPVKSDPITYVLMKIDVKIQLQIDHERYTFLMNLLETISRCSEEMEVDYKNITGKAIEPKMAIMSMILKEVEVSLLFPPSRDPSSQLTSPDEIGNSSGMLSDIQENTGSQLTLSEDGLLDPKSMLSCEEPESMAVPEISVPGATQPGNHLGFLSVDDVYRGSSPVEVGNDAMCLNEEEESGPRLFIGNGSASISLGGSRSQSPDANFSYQVTIPQSNSGTFSSSKKAPDLKKTFNQAFSSLTSKLGSQRNSARRGITNSRSDDASVDTWDNLSIASGSLSDEDDDYMWERIENQAERPAFERKRMVIDDNSGLEVDNDDTSSNCTAIFNKKIVSVFTVNIGNIEATVQSYGKESSIKAAIENMVMAEGGNMEMEKFFQMVNLGARDFTKWEIRPAGSHPIVRARFDTGQRAENLAPTAGEFGFIRALVDGIKVKLLASTLKNVGDLFEDSKPSPPNFLMNAMLTNIAVTFVDDKMPTYLPEPKNTTIDLVLNQTVITRGSDRIFRIGGQHEDQTQLQSLFGKVMTTELSQIAALTPAPHCGKHINNTKANDIRLKSATSDKSTETENKSTDRPSLESENDHLRRQLEKIGKMACCRKECSDLRTRCETLESVETENKELRKEMEHYMKELLLLKEEREALLTVVQKLQDDLSYSERMRSRPTLSS